MVKDFLDLRENPQNFTKECKILIRAYDPGLPNLRQFTHMILGFYKAWKWWENARKVLKTPLKPPHGEGQNELEKNAENHLNSLHKILPQKIDWSLT